ncbi:GRRM system radical SAM/SPASM domain protein [Myxococcaceae bacterium JPH2]|nr:GRRM system radical SAM/SPASM domain protein [Myxococcaceae bacterium JPH2]
MTLSYLVLQPTSLCNLNCTYCYVPGRRNTSPMSAETLTRVYECLQESTHIAKSLHLLWHAGEPLTVGLPYFRSAVAAQRSYSVLADATQSIQSNGTLITDDWCHFFQDNKIGVGVSLDGPEWIHDGSRRTWGNTGSHAKTMRGVRLLQKHGVDVHALAVITSESLDHAESFLQFFLDAGISQIAINIEEIENSHDQSSLARHPRRQQERYGRFIAELFELWWPHRERVGIREFEFIIDVAENLNRDPEFVPAPLVTKPGAMISVSSRGDIVPFSPELVGATSSRYHNFIVGNVHSLASFDDIRANSVYQQMARDVTAGVENCRRECGYYSLCGGGVPGNKYFENGSFDTTTTMFCQLQRKTLADVVVSALIEKSHAFRATKKLGRRGSP